MVRYETATENEVLDRLEVLLAIETLEYHNKNHLAFDDKKRNQTKRQILIQCLQMLGTTAKDWT
jgi:hypothetical protein